MSSPSGFIEFILNGKHVQLSAKEFNPLETLNSYLRQESVGLTGTKRGCNEGGCGACTVLMSFEDPVSGCVRHKAVDSCLLPVGSCHHRAITTIEGLGSSSKGVNAIQKAFIEHHATQCGYCTPGFIMSALSLLLEKPHPTTEDIIKHFDGNLCRCTGYRSIFEALREFTRDGCPNDFLIKDDFKGRVIEWNRHGVEEEVKSFQSNDVAIEGEGYSFYVPKDFDGVISLKKKYPDAVLLCGNTELFVGRPRRAIFLGGVIDMNYIYIKDGNLVIGAATPLSTILEFCETYCDERCMFALSQKLEHFASTQVRNVASIAGNIVHGATTSDTSNYLLATDAKIVAIDCLTSARREIEADSWFIGAKRNVLRGSEVVKEIIIPLSKSSEHIFGYRQSMRKSMDLSLVSTTMKVDIDDRNIIKSMRIAFGGVSSYPKRAKTAEDFLVGKEFNESNIKHAYGLIDDDFRMDESTPGGRIEFRKALTHSFLLRFFHDVEKERGRSFNRDIVDHIKDESP